MAIRFIRPEDVNECLEILPSDWSTPHVRARVGYLTLSRSGLVATSDDDGSISGFLLWEIDFFDDNSVYVRSVVVRHDRRHEGIGHELLDTAILHARSLGARRIFADVLRNGNEESRRGLEARGFAKAGYIENMHSENRVFDIYSRGIYAERYLKQ